MTRGPFDFRLGNRSALLAREKAGSVTDLPREPDQRAWPAFTMETKADQTMSCRSARIMNVSAL
jgi:hypothetical protein